MYSEKRRLKSREKASVPRERKRAAKLQGSSRKAAAKARSRVNYENKSLTMKVKKNDTKKLKITSQGAENLVYVQQHRGKHF